MNRLKLLALLCATVTLLLFGLVLRIPQAGAASVVTIVDSADVAVTYTGPWNHRTGTASYAGTHSDTQFTAGAAATIALTVSSGCTAQVKLFGLKADPGTTLGVLKLDGSSTAPFSAAGSGTTYQQLLSTISGIGSGSHSIAAVNNDAGGGILWVDYFEITETCPDPTTTTSSTSSTTTSTTTAPTTTSTLSDGTVVVDFPEPSQEAQEGLHGFVAFVLLTAGAGFSVLLFRLGRS